MRVVILPGNGCDDVRNANWYGWMASRLEREGKFSEVVLRDMPDPLRARRSIWLPFMLTTLKADATTLLVGHSSGAEAAMRYCEEHRVAGMLLVSACHTDLGHESERAAGYYPPSGGEWQWDKIKANAGAIQLIHGDDDPFIGLDEPKFVAASLGCELVVRPGRSHFFTPGDDLIEAVYAVQRAAEAAASAES